MESVFKAILISFLSLALSGCIYSSSPKENKIEIKAGDTEIFSVNVFPSSDSISWFVDGKKTAADGNTFEYSPDGLCDKDQHIIEVIASGSIKDSKEWVVDILKIAPELEDLAIKSSGRESVTLAEVNFLEKGMPPLNIDAFIGYKDEISIANGVVENFIEGPSEIPAGHYRFRNLEPEKEYTIIVVAENPAGNSIKSIDVDLAVISDINSDDYLEMTDREIGHLLWFKKIADCDLDDFSLIPSVNINDVPVTGFLQLGFSSYRYSIAFISYFLSIEQFHKIPACTEIIQPIFDRMINKMLEKQVWSYWANTSMGFPLFEPTLWFAYPSARDPVSKKNIMYSGHLTHMIGLYEKLYRDLKWSEEGSIVFAWSDTEKYIYSHRSLQQCLYDQMVNNEIHCIECEPNLCFAECNQHPILGFMLHDEVHGTDFFDANEPFMDWFLSSKMIDPISHEIAHFYLVKQKIKVSDIDLDFGNILSLITVPVGKLNEDFSFMFLRSGLTNGWTGAFMHGWSPDIIERHYPYQKENRVIELPDGTLRIEKEWFVDQVANGFFSMLAAEVGDTDTRDRLLAWTEDQYHPIWGEDGSFHYPSNTDYILNIMGDSKDSNTATGKIVACARAVPPNGLWLLHNTSFPNNDSEIPVVKNIDFPEVILIRAIYDQDKEALIITTKPGPNAEKASTDITVAQLDPEKTWQLYVDGTEEKQFTGITSLIVRVTLDGRHDIVIRAE